jgi:YVTN family beta-propeller protein
MFARFVRRARRRPRWVIVGSAVALLALCGVASAAALGGPFGLGQAENNPFGKHQVGEVVNGRMLVADNQWIAPPSGTKRVEFSDQDTLGGVISPDGTKFATASGSGGTGAGLRIVDLTNGEILQNVPSVNSTGTGGIIYSSDGDSLWVSEPKDVLRFQVGPEGTVTDPETPVRIPLSSSAPSGAYASGLALSADGTKLYVAINGNDTLGVIDTATNELTKEIPVGNAPREVVIVGDKAFVSDQGGRKAVAGDTTNNSDGTAIVSDPSTGAATTGTVSVVDLSSEAVSDTINVGLSPDSETLNGTTLFVTNSNSDTVSVIDTKNDGVTQTFNVEPLPGSTVGAAPNSVAMPDPHHLLVSVGRDNALAVFEYNGPIYPVKYEGLIPTDWYPDQVRYDSTLKKLIVSNLKGIGSRGPEVTDDVGEDTEPAGAATGHETHAHASTLDIFQMPARYDLTNLTHQVFSNNGWNRLEAEEHMPPSFRGKPQAVPQRLGEPSPIKHVFLIVKENRTYDQVLGDLGKGNGDPADAQFGEEITPNEHALANQFTDFDNFYDDGTQSADGHDWLVQADDNDYNEWNTDEWLRSYPAEGGDALSYQRDGFLWNAAERAHKTVSDYGEFEAYLGGPSPFPSWKEWYEDSKVLQGKSSASLDVPLDKYNWYSDVPSLNKISNHEYPLFNLGVPDQYRVDIWEQDFKQAEKSGNLPNLTIIWLPDDHTGGSPDPTPIASVADNDLGLGRIVGDVSHSQFWKNSAIFVAEDDSQAGVDHVDGHRAPIWIASPYARRGDVNSEYFTQLNMVKTIEQILDIQPMNQMDRAAMPMFNAFTNRPDDTPYDVQHNQIPLSLGAEGTEAETEEEEEEIAAVDTKAGKPDYQPDALKRTAVPSPEKGVAKAWSNWMVTKADKHLTGMHASTDSVNPEQLNRYDWYTAHGWSKPYPGDSKILAPQEVPGHNLPAGYLGED